MPKINELSTRPGGPQPTDEFWLASAGGAADFKSTIDALTTAVLGNMSTIVEGNNGVSVRMGGLHIQWRTVELSNVSLNSQNDDGTWRSGQQFVTWPEPFLAPVRCIPIVHMGSTGVTALPALGGAHQAVFNLMAADTLTFSGNATVYGVSVE